MANIERFEDIQAWVQTRDLARKIYAITKTGAFFRDIGLREQIRRAVVSILSNIAESFERGGDKEFVKFLYIAKGSCGEVRAQLCVARDQDYITEEEFRDLLSRCDSISKMISGLISYLKNSIRK